MNLKLRNSQSEKKGVLKGKYVQSKDFNFSRIKAVLDSYSLTSLLRKDSFSEEQEMFGYHSAFFKNSSIGTFCLFNSDSGKLILLSEYF